MLTRAFHLDPLLNYLTSHSVNPEKLKNIYFRFCVHSSQIRIVGNLCEAAALWVAPDAKVSIPKQLTLVPAIIANLGIRNLPKCIRAMLAVDKAHPTEPHFYLMALGVAPEIQGKGWGSEILKPTLAKCDQAKIPTYLDTSNPSNLPFYERLGFKTIKEIQISKEAPPLWAMWRKVGAS